MLSAITWDPSPILFSIGDFAIRHYAMCWLLGLIVAYYIIQRIYIKDNLSNKDFDKLVVYMFVGVFLGARLGHFIFYEPHFFIERPLEILLPIGPDGSGGYKITGYAGLASHGGAIGGLIAMWLYARKTGINMWYVFDLIALVTPITGCFIRIGNFWNSEIIGNPTGSDFGVIFTQFDSVPRHPSQLYEAIAYLIIFVCMITLFVWKRKELHRGFFFGLGATAVFICRFIIEFTKVNNGVFEGFPLNTGHFLSLPFIIVGIYCMCNKNIDKITLGTAPKSTTTEEA